MEYGHHALASLVSGVRDRAEPVLGKVIQKAGFWDNLAGQSINDRQRLMLNRLLDGCEGKLTLPKWAKLAKTSPDTALRDINDLVSRNILIKEAAGGRSTSYVLVSLLSMGRSS